MKVGVAAGVHVTVRVVEIVDVNEAVTVVVRTVVGVVY